MKSLKNTVSHFSTEPTFKQRVGRFWDWYASVAQRFYTTIESGKCPELGEETSKSIDEILGSFAWVFGPGSKPKEHSLTLSGEGDRHKQLLSRYWLECAPKLDGWTFYPARQPGTVEGWGLKIHDEDFRPIEFWLTPEVNEENQIVNLTVWHPLFAKLNDDQKWRVLFIVLDEALGEYGVQQWIGKIDMAADKLARSIPIKELRPFIADLEKSKGWKKLPPGEGCTGYSIKKQHDAFPRGDIFVGTTMHSTLLNDYLDAEGKWENPLAAYGADYAYLAIPADWFPDGKQVDARGKVEDALDAALRAEKSGRLLGGAMGTENGYIDLLLLDGARSREIVMRVAKECGVPAETELRSFASDLHAS